MQCIILLGCMIFTLRVSLSPAGLLLFTVTSGLIAAGCCTVPPPAMSGALLVFAPTEPNTAVFLTCKAATICVLLGPPVCVYVCLLYCEAFTMLDGRCLPPFSEHSFELSRQMKMIVYTCDQRIVSEYVQQQQ